MRGPAVRPIVIAAGGTGGHFFPAEALATILIARGLRVVLMTDARTGARLGPVFTGGEHYILRGAGIAGRGIRAAHAVMSLAAGTLQARHILSRMDAACVVGFGGYPSVPPILGARLLRRRPAIVVHEQNAVIGRANRLCLRAADVVALGFAQTAHVPDGTKTVFTGNPVRPAIIALAGKAYRVPTGPIRLLVLGGSLGARIFSDIVPDALANLPDDMRARLSVVQQCRPEDMARVRDIYDKAGVEAELAPFFDDIAPRLDAAHLVISRAGASSCAEIAVIGRPAILVPLPGAIDDHQMANARAMPGATVMAQRDFTAPALAKTLADLFAEPASLQVAAQRIAAGGRVSAAHDLADAIALMTAQTEVSR